MSDIDSLPLHFLLYKPGTLEPFLQRYVARPSVGFIMGEKVTSSLGIERHDIYVGSHKLLEVETSPSALADGVVVVIRQGLPNGTVLREGNATRTVKYDFMNLASAIIKELETDKSEVDVVAYWMLLRSATHWGGLTAEKYYQFTETEQEETLASVATPLEGDKVAVARPARFNKGLEHSAPERVRAYFKAVDYMAKNAGSIRNSYDQTGGEYDKDLHKSIANRVKKLEAAGIDVRKIVAEKTG